MASEDNRDDLDRALMLRLRDGEETVLNEIMARWQKPVTAFILRYAGSHEDALDLAQETFVRVFESRRRYKPVGKFSTWLFQIASNLCRNFARWRDRHPTVTVASDPRDGQESDPGGAIPSPADSPAVTAERTEIASAVRQHIQELPHDLKTVILLFEYEDLSHDEIGKVLGCSAKAVETRLYRARALLRKALSPYQ